VKSTIGAYEAKAHLPQLLERVAKGERITITKHGVPVATLQAASLRCSMPVAEVIAELRRFKSGIPWPRRRFANSLRRGDAESSGCSEFGDA